MASAEQMKDFIETPGWKYMSKRILEWRDSFMQDLLAASDIHEILRIQGRLQMLDVFLKTPAAFEEDIRLTQTQGD